MSKREKVLIVGAGISGIAAARFEMDKGNDVVLLDSSDRPGGLLKSDLVEGYYFDYGTHIIPQTGMPELDGLLFGDLATEDYVIKKLIPAGNYFNGQLNEKSCYVDTTTLPRDLYNQGCVDALSASQDSADNLRDWYNNRYGETFSEEIFCPVIEKYIGVDASRLTPSVGYFFDMSRLLAFDQETTDILGSIDRYYAILGHHVRKDGVQKYYPRKGGVGAFVDHMLTKLDGDNVRLLLGNQIKTISHENGRVKEVAIGDELLKIDRLIWTIPVALLALYVPLGVKVKKPEFRKTSLFDFAFDMPLLSDTTFINVYDLGMKSGRITLYQNLSGLVAGNSHCTVEVLSDEPVEENDILDELKTMGLLASDCECLLKRQRDVVNGFPILDLEYVAQSRVQSNAYHQHFKNIDFLGKASEKAFFMTDVLKETYTRLVVEAG